MIKLFISQPMNGKTDSEIKKEREQAIEEIESSLSTTVEVIDSYFESAPDEAKPLWFLGKSLELLANADVAYFAKGWEVAIGCKIEHYCAMAYGIKCVEFKEDK